MTRCILCCVSILALVAAAAPGHAKPIARGKLDLPKSSSSSAPAESDCEAGIQKLEASQAEGEERLAEKRQVIDRCSSEYRRDKAIERLVKECARYEEQPVLKQQFVAECQLAAFNYANALRTLKAGHGK